MSLTDEDLSNIAEHVGARVGAAIQRHAEVTQPAARSTKKDWIRSVTAAIVIGGALSTVGFFLFKSDAEATDEKTSADGKHLALEVKDASQDDDRYRIEKQHEKRFEAIDSKLEKIIDNQVRQSYGRRAKPNGD